MRSSSRRALVVRGGWAGHFPVEATDRFIPFLRDRGFTVDVSDTLDAYLDADLLAATDLVVPLWTMGELTPDQSKGLDHAVRSGTGLAGWHGGICDAFRDDRTYNFMVGGQFVNHPGGFVDYECEVISDHPIIRGIGRFAVHSEQYYVHVDPSITVHATTTFAGTADYPWIAGATVPVVWTKSWGAGRVFVCTVGHKPDDLDLPEVRTIVERGLLWASR